MVFCFFSPLSAFIRLQRVNEQKQISNKLNKVMFVCVQSDKSVNSKKKKQQNQIDSRSQKIINQLQVNKIFRFEIHELIMQSLRQHIHDHQSEIEEGFIQTKNIVDEKAPFFLKKEQLKTSLPKKQFVPRHILEGVLRKQPEQCYKRFLKYDYVSQIHLKAQKTNYQVQDEMNIEKNNIKTTNQNFLQTKTDNIKNNKKQQLLIPYDKFVESGDYTLVYSRSKDFKFTKDQPNFANNYVKLDCLKSTEDKRYKIIKPFENNQQKREDFMLRNTQRSNTTRENVLQFDSKFECGNLLCAYKHKKQSYTYTLFIQNDSNTYGYNHWFYFSIKNAEAGVRYEFNIVNFRKRHSFFKQGNKPVVFSLKDSRREGMSGYSKRGENIKYGKSSILKSYESKEKFFQLSFNIKFWHDNDLYYISTGLPYSYSRLLKSLSLYEEIAHKNNINFTLESISTSVAGNSIPYLTITKFQGFHEENIKQSKSYRQQSYLIIDQQPQSRARSKSKNFYQQQPKATKRVIFLIARQHPGETWSSYLIDQFIHSLVVQATPESKYLLQNFIIKCIPMVNVDGVISGNFRCDLTGIDLNRNWKTPSDLLHPQIFSIKNQILNLIDKGHQIETFFDLHGHSKEYNLFCYSCKIDNYECRLMPYIFSKLNEEFNFPLCTFGISRYKQTTARVVVFGIIKNSNVLTIECSFFGSSINGQTKIFQPQSMKKMAQTIIKGCKSYFSHDQHYHLSKQIVRQRIDQFLSYKGQNTNCAFSGSDSEPSGDQIEINQRLQKILPKNLIKECEEFAQIKKPLNKPKRKTRKEQTLAKDEKVKTKRQQGPQTQVRTIDSQKNESPTKFGKNNWQALMIKKSEPIQNSTSPNFKHRTFFISNKKIDEKQLQTYRDLLDKQDQRLSFLGRERQEMIQLKLHNESSQIFKDAYNATEKKIKPRYDLSLDDIKDQKRLTNKRLTIYKDSGKKNIEKQEFPLLCIMSQNKKKKQIQIIQNRIQQSGQKNSNHHGQGSSKIKTGIQTRTEAIKQLRQRNKNNIDLVSKIWRDNYHKYGMAYSSFRIMD